MNLRPDEVELVGQWILVGEKVDGDATCKRIRALTDGILQEVAVSKLQGGWETLFRDPVDGRLWERTYPQGHLHGGGPPALRLVSAEVAREKYGVDV